MITDVRRILDDSAVKKGRERLLLGVRVSPMLEGPYIPEEFPGSHYWQRENPSCRDLGLDLKTWIQSGNVDYVCPMLFNTFLPGLPKTREFADLAAGTEVGVYPTLFAVPMWLCPAHGHHRPPSGTHEPPLQPADERLERYKHELCECALRMYADGADGISTFNWWPHHQPGMVKDPDRMAPTLGLGGKIFLFNAVSHWNDWFTGEFLITNRKLTPLQTWLHDIMQTVQPSSYDFRLELSRRLRILAGGDEDMMDQLLRLSTSSVQKAAIVLTVLPIIILYLFLQRYFIKGVLIGSLRD